MRSGLVRVIYDTENPLITRYTSKTRRIKGCISPTHRSQQQTDVKWVKIIVMLFQRSSDEAVYTAKRATYWERIPMLFLHLFCHLLPCVVLIHPLILLLYGITNKRWFKQISQPFQEIQKGGVDLTYSKLTFETRFFATFQGMRWSRQERGFNHPIICKQHTFIFVLIYKHSLWSEDPSLTNQRRCRNQLRWRIRRTVTIRIIHRWWEGLIELPAWLFMLLRYFGQVPVGVGMADTSWNETCR